MKTAGTQSKLFGMTCVSMNPMDRSHLIELADMDASASPNPWSASKFKQELTKPFVSAYGVVGPDRTLIASAVVRKGDMAVTLTDILVRPEYRRRGVGKMLIDCIRKKCLNETRKFLEVVVSDGDLGTHLFLKACKFRGEVIRDEKCDYYMFRSTKDDGDCA
jgi:ribosomal protein S18 acetylase RimI-like enzyme